MGHHIMKTTIEIADDLFERAQRLAGKEKTTFRSLAEQGLPVPEYLLAMKCMAARLGGTA
jgi:hypothetical protein